MPPDVEWDVTRTGNTVRINVNDPSSISEADRDAIVAATEEFLVDDGVSLLQLDGPAVGGGRPSRGLAEATRALERLAEQHGKQLIVGPI
jgi:hypothetical protein